MRIADVVADFIVNELNIKHIFTVTGGGAMFLNDAFGNHPRLMAIYNHHEQASAMAAVGYSKVNNSYSAVCVTTGCGGTNAITGVLDAWQDSNPVFFISGQVKRRETSYNAQCNLRQFGVQEANIIEIVKSITKYSVMINNPDDILFELQKAKFIAKSGRPGPVWIDIPLDIQGADVEVQKLKQFDNQQSTIIVSDEELIGFYEKVKKSKRPVIIAGNGIRLGNAESKFKKFVENTKIPTVFSYLSFDLLPSEHPSSIGRLGTKGDRAGNFSVQNADLVIVLGSRLSVSLTGFEYKLFAREAFIIVVDIDEEEHKKNTVRIDKFIHSDIGYFLDKILNLEVRTPLEWINKCIEWKLKWPVYQDIYRESELINMYEFINSLCKFMPDNSIIISDAGSAYYITSQALQIKENQRYITSGAQADMGFTLPAAIGVGLAKPGNIVIGITGDGSFQMNIQELQTVIQYKIPLKIVIWNNDGYLSIKSTQKRFFYGRYAGTDKNSGISCPNHKKIAKAYGIKYFSSQNSIELQEILPLVLQEKEAVIYEIFCPPNQEILPSVSSIKKSDGSITSKPIEDMSPLLSREEFFKNMIVKPIQE